MPAMKQRERGGGGKGEAPVLVMPVPPHLDLICRGFKTLFRGCDLATVLMSS